MLDKSDKIKFIEKVIDYQLKEKTLAELSINRYVLVKKIEDVINEILQNYAKERFNEFITKGKIKVELIEKFPDTITLSQSPEQEWNKNYYENVDRLNKEELNFVQRLDLDGLKNIKFWARNRERKDFFIQGWRKNKFYPDFIAVTERGNILVLEWKGEDRVSNEDTEYKESIGKIWEKLGKGKLYFFLVYNKNIEEVLIKIKEL